MWVALVEKAFAKMCLNYAATESGFAAWGMTYLCGQQGEIWNKQDDIDSWAKDVVELQGDEWHRGAEGVSQLESYKNMNQLWAALLKYSSRNYPMCCSGAKDEGQSLGLISGHAYSLLMAKEVRAAGGKTLKLLKIRNPHGESEWKGSWADGSSKWNKYPAVAQKLGYIDVDDGMFWMSFKDFVSYFSTFSVCKRSMPLEGIRH